MRSWYILYSAGAGDIPTGQRSFVLQGCDTNPYDCEYTFLAELTPAPGSQGGSDGNDPWSIDGTFIIIGEGRYHVVSAHNSANVQSIMITALDTTNWTVGPWSIISEPTEDWEMANPPPDGPAAVNEAPNPLYNSGRTWLSFSTSFCGSPSYALGLLEYNGSGDPLDPASWVKTGPVFSAASENYSTAHNVFFSSPDGTEVWVRRDQPPSTPYPIPSAKVDKADRLPSQNAYHATTNPEGSCGTDRYTMAQIVTFDETGFPFLGEPVWGLTDIQVPSGDGA